jgi:hypothetical protein
MKDVGNVQKVEFLNGMLGRYSRLDELGLFEQHALCHLKQRV